MKMHIRSALAATAVLVAGGFLTAVPAAAQEKSFNGWCNPVMTTTGWGNTAVTSAGDVPVIHAGSYACQTAAAPAAPSAARPQTEYLVFFDWDRANITPAAERTIGDAVTAWGRGATTKIHVVGHTDTSGSPAYNQRLSIRRAEAVKQRLVALGLPAANVTTEGKGETQLLVQTGANVREPSNRRAQILNRSASAPSS